ncbi:type II toxin-antitoxin system VapC family toxin [Paracoccus sp. SSK6]|uniref:type II toxin-antitoxin system VapC family toxin n=1 Tax=Paracoccus sp. SSK6 TaxID=3143131 RepID=UPI00321A0F84
MTTLLDTNIISALTERNHRFHEWAMEKMAERRLDGPTAIADIAYSEASIVFETSADLDLILMRFGIDRIRASNNALFRAGRAWMEYKRRHKGQVKKGVLPDYMIGAIAECEQIPLMTTNPGDYATYFPDVPLIQPPAELMAGQRTADPIVTEVQAPGYLDDLLGP